MHVSHASPYLEEYAREFPDQSMVINIYYYTFCHGVAAYLLPPPSGSTCPWVVVRINQQHHSKRCNNMYVLLVMPNIMERNVLLLGFGDNGSICIP